MSTAQGYVLDTESHGDELRLRLSGRATLENAGGLATQLAEIEAASRVHLDLAATDRIDTAGAYAIARLSQRVRAAGGKLYIDGASPEARALIAQVEAGLPKPDAAAETGPKSIADRLEAVGRATVRAVGYLAEITSMFGLFLHRIGRLALRPGQFRMTAFVHHAQEVGVRAVPIVAVMAFLIGVVLAFQGATQLRQFGAEVFVVDLIAISILRELGILLTSIIVAGRTASAFTAAIGSMKMREEIDAMRTLGIDPAEALFVPRILALLVMLPILGLIANVAGLMGGAIMAWIELGISPGMFRVRLIDGTDVSHVFVGLVKAPVFALIIGVIGCHAGMKVGSSAESLGQQTSKAVVAAIFAVIIADAIFSIFFAQVGI